MEAKKQTKNLYVIGASSIAQYQLHDRTPDGKLKTITVIGESHLQSYEDYTSKCPQPQISVLEYISIISKDSNLMLEIPPGSLNCNTFMSSNLNSILQDALDNKINTVVTGIDIRPSLINHSRLYNNDEKLNNLKLLDFMSYYYMKMPSAVKYVKNQMISSNISSRQTHYLKKYIEQLRQEHELIKKKFEPYIGDLILKNENITIRDYINTKPKPVKGVNAKGETFVYTIIDILRIFWMKITDFMILLNLYISDLQHSVLLIGYNHAENFDGILFKYRKFPNPYKPLKSRIKHCTNTYGSRLYHETTIV